MIVQYYDTKTCFYNGATYTRVTKAAARRAFENGETVIFCPCNLRPFDPWHPETPVEKTAENNDFQKLVNAFEFYNCINTETGKYTAFYMEV